MSLLVIPDGHLRGVCKAGTHAACSFVTLTPDGFECGKGSPDELEIILRRAEGGIRAMNDNCSGPPDFGPPLPEATAETN